HKGAEPLGITSGIGLLEVSGIAGGEIYQLAVDGCADAPQRAGGRRYLERRELHEPYILLLGGLGCLDTSLSRPRCFDTESRRHRDDAQRNAFLCGQRKWALWRMSRALHARRSKA